MSSSSSSSWNWVYDVFPSFRGEDVRKTFLSHFLRELDRKLIRVFKDNKIEKSESLDPVLKKAIKDSRIAIVIFSQNYASSSWCLNELVEIVKCKDEWGQLVIPVFYHLDPCHVRYQVGEFGKVFEKTCLRKTEEVKHQWKQALTNVANLVGFHSQTWESEATLIEVIANDMLDKLNFTPSKDFEDFVGIEDHIAELSVMLQLESEEVRTTGIWGPSGIGKTTIARALFSRLSRHFQGRIFIDRRFISKCMEEYSKSNPDDYNMRLHLQESFLSNILDKKDIKIDHLGAVREKLKHQKVLIFIDDLDKQVVLDALVGGDEWFGCGSRIIVITKDKRLLESHGISHIYEVGFPSEEQAIEMFCRSAFQQNSPPDGFEELASEVAVRAGCLPLGLVILGKVMRRRNKEDWINMLPRLRKNLNGDIEKTLRVSYNDLECREDKALFRHIACFFNGEEINNIKWMLADSDLDVNIGLKNLADKALINLIPTCNTNIVKMHCLVQDMGKEIVRTQSEKPGKREFLLDSKDVCNVLEGRGGTEKVLGISLDTDEIDDNLWIHRKAFKNMSNLRFLKIYAGKWDKNKEVKWNLMEGFNYLPAKLRLLKLDGYPMRCLPSNFRPQNLVNLTMRRSKLEKLWDGVHSLTGLKYVDMSESKNLREIPDLSMATNLEKLELEYCTNLVQLPSSIQYLKKLASLRMDGCTNLETLPTGMNLESLELLDLNQCSSLRTFPELSTNISTLTQAKTAIEEFPSNLHLENLLYLTMCDLKSKKLWGSAQPLTPLMTMLSPSLTLLSLSDIPSLVELPSSFQNLHRLTHLKIIGCKNLETLPTGINLRSLHVLDLSGCLKLKYFPDISTNISTFNLSKTGIEEVPWWDENFSRLSFLHMKECNNLRCVSLDIAKLKRLQIVDFSDCVALTEASWDDSLSSSMEACKVHSELLPLGPIPKLVFTSYYDNCSREVKFNFTNCLSLDQDALIQQQPIFKQLMLSGEEVPSYFTHRTTGTCLTIPLFETSISQPVFQFQACAVVSVADSHSSFLFDPCFKIQVCCRFIDRLESYFDYADLLRPFSTTKLGSCLVIFECCFPLSEDNTPLAELNFDHVNIYFDLMSDNTMSKLKGCGIRLSHDPTPLPDIVANVTEGDERNINNETEDNQACSSDTGAETERSKKRVKIM